MIFIYCDWFSTQWQWSVNIYQKERKGTKGETIHKRIPKFRIHKIENKLTKKDTNIQGMHDCDILLSNCRRNES